MPKTQIPPEESLQTRVHAALVNLGDTGVKVADNLGAAGVFGRQLSVTACPIARYLAQVDPAVDRVYALPELCIVYGPDGIVHVDTPPAVARFMAGFDLGRFDALLESAVTA